MEFLMLFLAVSTEKSKLTGYVNLLESYAVANEWLLDNLEGAIKKAASMDSLIKAKYRID